MLKKSFPKFSSLCKIFGTAMMFLLSNPLTLTARGVAPCNGETTSDYMILTVTNSPPIDFTWDISCSGWPVQFNIDDVVTDIGSIASYSWNFGDGTTSIIMEPTHTYAVPGLYDVTLIVVGIDNYSNTVLKSVKVNELPVALFSYESPSCKGEPTIFINHSSSTDGYITEWLWDFGDGTQELVNFPEDPNVSHTYTNANVYTATLTVTSSTGCVAAEVHTITIQPSPVANFKYPTGNCAENNVQFTDLSQPNGGSQIVSWVWNFGDPTSGVNNTSNLQNPAHFFNTAGTYTVTLTTTNVDNCSGTITKQIIVDAGPAVKFIITSDTCVASDVSFEPDAEVMDPASVASYLWNFGDGSTSNLPAPIHVYNLAGTFQVTLTVVNNNGCTNSVSRQVTIGALPDAAFSYISACIDNATTFTDYSYTGSGEPIISWLWKFNDPNGTDSSAQRNPVFKYTAQGTYNVTLTVTTANGCPGSKTIPVQVFPAPKANFNYITNACANDNVFFQDSSINNLSAITEWKWEFEPGYISTLKNPYHIFSNTDSYYNVRLVVTDMRGCVDTLEKKVYIPAELKVDIDHTPACLGVDTWFKPVAPPDALNEFQWDFGDPASGNLNTSVQNNPFHSFQTPGSYLVSLTVTDTNYCQKTVYHQVDIQEMSVPVFSYTEGICDNTVNFNASPTGGGVAIKSWIWNFGDPASGIDSISILKDSQHIFTAPGMYYVTLTVINRSDCSATFSDSLLVKPCLHAIFTEVNPPGCQNQAITFADGSSSSGIPLTKWFWDFGDGDNLTYNDSLPTISHIFKTSGIFNVKLVISTQIDGNTVIDSVTHQVKVNPSPIAGYITKDIAGDTTKGVCLGLPAKFNNTSSGNGSEINLYEWDFGDLGTSLDTSSANNPTYTYEHSGDFYARLVATNPFGCSDTIIDTLTVHPLPIANFQFSNSCVGDTTRFMDVSDTVNASLTKWEWDFKDLTTLLIGHDTVQNPYYLFATEGNSSTRLIITNNNGCKDDTLMKFVTHPSPVSAFEIEEDYDNVQGQIHLRNGTLGATGYEWDFDNGFTSTAKDPTIKYEYEGTYNIKLISYNSFQCADTLMKDYILLFKGLYVPNAFSPLPPNSSNIPELFNLFKPVGINLETYKVEVYDSWGKLQWSSTSLDANGSPDEYWDGTSLTDTENLLPQDVYVWRITAVFRDRTAWNSKNAGNHTNIPEKTYGTVTLLR